MNTLEVVRKQKAIAKLILNKLDFPEYEVALAGGAPRDWYLGEKANDLDIFICNVPSDKSLEELKEALQEQLGREVYPLIEKKYETTEFYGFETHYEFQGLTQTIQFLFHFKDLKTTVKEFPVNISRIWWDGEFHTHWTFSFWTNYQLLIFEGGCNDSYVDKIHFRFGYGTVSLGLKEALFTYGRKLKRERENPLDVGGFAFPMF